MDKQELTFLLKKYNLTPNKLRGQNFLISDDVLKQIIEAANINKKDLVLEVGPGLCALTNELIKVAKQVVAFEVDKNFEEVIEKLQKVTNNLEVIWQDILSLQEETWQEILNRHQASDYKIVANIPYYLTGKFVQKFILAKNKPVEMILMVQKEVAQRMTDDKQSLLSLSIALYAQVDIVAIVDKQNFYPAPKVDSAIIKIYNIKPWSWQANEEKVWQLIHRGFAYKRKKLFNNLLSDQNLDKQKLTDVFTKLNIDLNIRAERLSTQEWIHLAEML